VDSYASAINASGQIVGYSNPAGATVDVMHGFLYSGGSMSDLGVLSGGAWSQANGINTWGQVVGEADNGAGSYDGFVYFGGGMTDLNNLLDSTGSGWQICDATAVNDSGQITGWGYNADGYLHAFILTPHPAVAGKVTLQDFKGSPSSVQVTIQIRTAGTTTAVQTQTQYLNSDGTFEFASTLSGTYDVAIKASHWLREKLSSVVLSGKGVTGGLSVSLINGDVNGDNTINLADLVAMAAAWRTTSSSSNWNVNADLNGDGVVNLADWMIAARNYRKTGDQ
jgi:probable HAF family extracellular repeat protein